MDSKNLTFVQFITKLLSEKSTLGGESIKRFTNEKSMEIFKLAFTHKSFDKTNNYELLEFIGDLLVNYSVGKYIIEWDKNIQNVEYLTRLKHNITSKKHLALMAEKSGFFEHMLIDTDVREKMEKLTPEQRHSNLSKNGFMSMLEDCFEAFIGAVSQVIEKETGSLAAGNDIARKIVFAFCDELDISLDYTDVIDKKTQYKELCDKNRWDVKKCIDTKTLYENKKTIYETNVYAYPLGDKTMKKENRVLLSTKKGIPKVEMENQASEEAINKLKNIYNIAVIPKNPYSKKN